MLRLRYRSAAALALATVLTLAGCTSTPPAESSGAAPSPQATSSGATTADSVPPSPAPSGTAPAAALLPSGSANDNLGKFTEVVRTVWGGPDQVSGRAYIDALVAAGFDKTAMQVTPDTTTIGNPAESIEFSVRWGEDCLVGQVGPSIGDPVTSVLPGLSTGSCLIGETRAIDW